MIGTPERKGPVPASASQPTADRGETMGGGLPHRRLALVAIMLVRPAGLWPSPNREERPNAALARDDEKEAAAV